MGGYPQFNTEFKAEIFHATRDGANPGTIVAAESMPPPLNATASAPPCTASASLLHNIYRLPAPSRVISLGIYMCVCVYAGVLCACGRAGVRVCACVVHMPAFLLLFFLFFFSLRTHARTQCAECSHAVIVTSAQLAQICTASQSVCLFYVVTFALIHSTLHLFFANGLHFADTGVGTYNHNVMADFLLGSARPLNVYWKNCQVRCTADETLFLKPLFILPFLVFINFTRTLCMYLL